MNVLRALFLTTFSLSLFGCPVDEDPPELPQCVGSSECCVSGQCYIGTSCTLDGGGDGMCEGRMDGLCYCAVPFGGGFGGIIVTETSGGGDDGGLRRSRSGALPDRIRYVPPTTSQLRLPEALRACPTAIDPMIVALDGDLDIRRVPRLDRPTDRLVVEGSTLHTPGVYVPCFGETGRLDLELDRGVGHVDPVTGAVRMTLEGRMRSALLTLQVTVVVEGAINLRTLEPTLRIVSSDVHLL